MSKLVKVLKLLFVLVLTAGVVCGILFGVLTIKPEAEAALEVPYDSLGKIPFSSYDSTNLENNTFTMANATGTFEYSPEFSLYDFLHDTEMAWQRSDYKNSVSGKNVAEADGNNYLLGTWDDTTGYTGDDSDPTVAIGDAINLIKLASYNEKTVPYFRTYTDAGGMAVIGGGAITGGLMVQGQEIYNNLSDYQIYWKEQINAIANAKAPGMESLIPAVEQILNKAIREGTYNNHYWFHKGSGPIYTAVGNLDDIDIPALDEGICSANWSATGNDSNNDQIRWSTLSQEAGAKWRKNYNDDGTEKSDKVWQEMYSVKYIIDLTRDEAFTGNWFKDATITKVYVDADGKDSTTPTDHWYLNVELNANLPSMDELAPNFNDLSKSEQREIINKNYMTQPLNMYGWDGTGNPTFADCTWSGKWKGYSNIFKLLEYTGASPVCYTQLTYEVEIWDTGLLKKWNTVEGWYGELVGLQANVKPYSPVVYSYDYNVCTEDIIKEYLVKYTNATIAE